MKITPFFRWYDLWIGAYVDTKNRTVYLCPLPMVGVKISLPHKSPNRVGTMYDNKITYKICSYDDPIPACPFCGGEASMNEDTYFTDYYVICSLCRAIGPMARSPRDAAQKWNIGSEPED